jgi:hypothetical protein
VVKTGKAYLEQLEAIGKAEAACFERVRKEFEPRWKDLRAWYAAAKKAIDEAEARGENVKGRREALEREMDERSKPLRTAESKAEDECADRAQGARDSLEREARESGADIPRLIIAAEGMAARAEHMRLSGVPGLGDVPIEDYAIVTVLSFAQLKRALSIDRVCDVVIFVLPHLAVGAAARHPRRGRPSPPTIGADPADHRRGLREDRADPYPLTLVTSSVVHTHTGRVHEV